MTTTDTGTELDELCINTIRTLSIDAVQKANSGHPGAPMGLAPVAYTLFTRLMRHNPANPSWIDRDRFILSAGHASMLLYSSLYLTGYPMTLEDLENFRQIGSPTAGHPEYWDSPGIEATTGPLGQGISMSVGLALAEHMLAARYNRDGHDVVGHQTFVIASDGDMQEGIASEASSLAGHLGLGRLIVFYDDNKVQLAGPTSQSFTEDVGKRYEAYGWHVDSVGDDLSPDRIERAARDAMAITDKPSLIIVQSHIGFGSPNKQDSSKAHGSPLGEDEVRLTKEAYGWDPDKTFYVPEEALAHFRECLRPGPRVRIRVAGTLRRLPRGVPRAGGRARADRGRARTARRLGGRPATVLARRRRDRHPRRLGQGDPVGGREGAVADRRLGRPGQLQQHRYRRRRGGADRRVLPVATSTSASASTRWARSSTGSSCTASAPTAAPSSPSLTT